MKVIQITEKLQKIIRYVRWSWENVRNQMLNNPITEETAGKTGRTKLQKQRFQQKKERK